MVRCGTGTGSGSLNTGYRPLWYSPARRSRPTAVCRVRRVAPSCDLRRSGICFRSGRGHSSMRASARSPGEVLRRGTPGEGAQAGPEAGRGTAPAPPCQSRHRRSHPSPGLHIHVHYRFHSLDDVGRQNQRIRASAHPWRFAERRCDCAHRASRPEMRGSCARSPRRDAAVPRSRRSCPRGRGAPVRRVGAR
jgi:hypothetical protein